MNELERELEQITKELKNIDKKLDELEKKEKELDEEDGVPFGLLSLVEDHVKIELLMEEKLFTEEELNKLKDIAQEIQDMLIAVHSRNN